MKTLPFLLLLILIGCNKEPIFTDAGPFTDTRDNYVYKSVLIGNQTWMAENLAYLPFVNSSSDTSGTSPIYSVHGYDGTLVSEAKGTNNYTALGVLYNWVAATTACPSGWHLPTDEEWKILEMYLGMSKADADFVGLRKSGSVGMKLKSASGWPNTPDGIIGNGDNSSGFTAITSGYRYGTGGFESVNTGVTFWSSTESDASHSWTRQLGNATSGVFRGQGVRNYGISARCIKDE